MIIPDTDTDTDTSVDVVQDVMHLHRQQILHKTPRQGVTEAGNTYYTDTDTDTGYRILQQILHVYYCTGAGYIEDGFPPVELDVT